MRFLKHNKGLRPNASPPKVRQAFFQPATWSVEILRCAQNDREEARDDREEARDDREEAQDDREEAQNDREKAQ